MTKEPKRGTIMIRNESMWCQCIHIQYFFNGKGSFYAQTHTDMHTHTESCMCSLTPALKINQYPYKWKIEEKRVRQETKKDPITLKNEITSKI